MEHENELKVWLALLHTCTILEEGQKFLKIGPNQVIRPGVELPQRRSPSHDLIVTCFAASGFTNKLSRSGCE